MAVLNKIILQSKINKNVVVEEDKIANLIYEDFKNISIKEFIKFFEMFLNQSKIKRSKVLGNLEKKILSNKSKYMDLNPDLFHVIFLFIQAYDYISDLEKYEIEKIDQAFENIRKHCGNKDIVDRIAVHYISNRYTANRPKAEELLNMKNILLYVSRLESDKYANPLENYIYSKTNGKNWKEVYEADPEFIKNFKPNIDILKVIVKEWNKWSESEIHNYLNKWKDELVYDNACVKIIKKALKHIKKFNYFKLNIRWQEKIMPASQQAADYWADKFLELEDKYIAVKGLVKNFEAGFRISEDKMIKLLEEATEKEVYISTELIYHTVKLYWYNSKIKELIKQVCIKSRIDILVLIKKLKENGISSDILDEISEIYLIMKFGTTEVPLHQLLIHFKDEIDEAIDAYSDY